LRKSGSGQAAQCCAAAQAPHVVTMGSYDVVIAGARCAGASTAMLLARRGLRVLVVDPLKRGSDTLSTHALMRAGVLQLHRWGLLDAIRSAGTPPIHSTTFHYGTESIRVPIKPRDGVEALYAPRRTVLDPILVAAAESAGAEVRHRVSVVELVRDGDGRVCGVRMVGPRREVTEVSADLVIGADGVRSRVARLLQAPIEYAARHAATSIYGYWRGVTLDGNHWFYEPGASVGTIPTNGDETCVFALLPRGVLRAGEGRDLPSLHREALERVSPPLAKDLASAEAASGLRAFAGLPGFLRRSHGPGWALVGDAGYFRDPITAHGMTDALRDAELLARSLAEDGVRGLAAYQTARDEAVRGLLDVTDRIASFEWGLDEAKELHLALSRAMNAEVEMVLEWDGRARPSASHPH